MSRFCFFLLLYGFIFPLHSVFSQNRIPASYRFMFYNVENLFDTEDDSLADDNEFLPSGTKHWTESRFRNKVNSLYKVISAVGEWDPPALAGFCEIENRYVLQAVVRDTWLSKFDYGILTGETGDPRGIRNGIIFRKDLLKLISSRSLAPLADSSGVYRSRCILYSVWLAGSDTLHLFLNHWPSRRRGVLAEERVRNSISLTLSESIDSLFRISGTGVRIIVAGDFNCSPDDPVMGSIYGDRSCDRQVNTMINLTSSSFKKGEGTYKYRGRWEMLDQVIVSKGLLDAEYGIFTSTEMFRIFRPGFLLLKDDLYPGSMPFPTYRGFRYTGGFSDHLPVILDLSTRQD